MNFDLNTPAQLTAALGPDLLLMGGAMILLLWAGWRRESDAHQRSAMDTLWRAHVSGEGASSGERPSSTASTAAQSASRRSRST